MRQCPLPEGRVIVTEVAVPVHDALAPEVIFVLVPLLAHTVLAEGQ